jgi:hypothetical protein
MRSWVQPPGTTEGRKKESGWDSWIVVDSYF